MRILGFLSQSFNMYPRTVLDDILRLKYHSYEIVVFLPDGSQLIQDTLPAVTLLFFPEIFSHTITDNKVYVRVWEYKTCLMYFFWRSNNYLDLAPHLNLKLVQDKMLYQRMLQKYQLKSPPN